MSKKNKPLKKIALSLSLWAILVWALLGTGTSLAWFTDTDVELNNIFHFAEFNLQVEYLAEDGTYKDLEGATKVFDDKALYEPGYVQVVYLRITNAGDVPFRMKTAVSVTDYTVVPNVYGQEFHLQDYLKFGLVTAPQESGLDLLLADREDACGYAQMPLNNYSTDTTVLNAKTSVYMALIVRMPENVGNVANYRGDEPPRVELGIIVSAVQVEAPQD